MKWIIAAGALIMYLIIFALIGIGGGDDDE